jgi:hypothetical protein
MIGIRVDCAECSNNAAPREDQVSPRTLPIFGANEGNSEPIGYLGILLGPIKPLRIATTHLS